MPANTMTGDPSGLTDGYERRIDYLRVSVTDRCNMRCIYCTPKNGFQHFDRAELLTHDEIISIVQAAHQRGVKKVRLTGGEPLLRDDILSLVASIKQAGIRDLSLTTNGMLLAGMAADLKKAGLDRVNISIDSLDPARFSRITRGGDFRLVRRGLQAAVAFGLHPVKINMVVLRGVNDDEVERFALLTMENDFHVRFIEYMPVGQNGWDREQCVTAAEVMERVTRIAPLAALPYRGRGPSRNYRLSGARGVVGFISPVSDHFCRHCNRLRLTATGTLRPCLFSESGIDVRSSLRAGAAPAAIVALFELAAAAKPRGHNRLSAIPAGTARSAMVQIGG